MSIVGGAPGHVFTRASVIANAPAVPGVYALFNTDWVYFGEGDDIRRCLLDVLSTAQTCLTKNAPTGFAFELASGSEKAVICDELNRFYAPPCGDCVAHARSAAQCLKAALAPPCARSVTAGRPLAV